MGYGFKMGGRGIILKDPKLELSVESLSISGAELTKTFSIDWEGDGEPIVTSSDTNIATVSLNRNIVTATFISQGNAIVTVTIPQTKHYFSNEIAIPVTCTRSNPTLTLKDTTLTVSGAAKTGTLTISVYNGDGVLTASSVTPTVATVSAVGANKTATITYVTAGTSKITISASQGTRYNAATAVCTVTCSKSTPSYTAPKAKTGLTYTSGSSFDLLTAGSVTSGQGTMQYSADNSTWGTTIPKGTNAKKYTVYYRIVGNTYYSDVRSTPIEVTISKRSLTIPTLKSNSVAFIGSSVSVGVNNYDSTYENQSGTSASSVGTHTATWSLKDTSNTQWKDGTITNKTAQWSTYAGTITWYIQVTITSTYGTNYVTKFTMKTTYNVSWRTLCNKVYSSNRSEHIPASSWAYVTGSPTSTNTTNWANQQCTTSGQGFFIYQYESGQGTEIPAFGGQMYVRNSSSLTDFTNMSPDTVPTNGTTYYVH